MVGIRNDVSMDGRYDTSVIGQFKSLHVFPKAGKFSNQGWHPGQNQGRSIKNDLRLATHGITIETWGSYT